MKQRFEIEKRVRDEDSYFQNERNLTFEVRDLKTGELLHIFTGSTTDSNLGSTSSGTRAVHLNEDGRSLRVADLGGSVREIALPE